MQNRFSCLKIDTSSSTADDIKRTNRFSRGEDKSPVNVGSRWKRSRSPEKQLGRYNKSPVNVHSRWQRSKSPEKSNDRWDNNKSPVNVHSRWQRSRSPEDSDNRYGSRSPERGNSFTKRNDRNNGKHNKGGFGKYRYNHGRGGPSEKFDKVKKDMKGRPMVAGATTGGFDINLALKRKEEEDGKRDPKLEEMKKKEEKKKRKKKGKNVVFEKEKLDKADTEQQKKLAAEWNKRMIDQMQYESEEEGEDCPAEEDL